MDQSVSWNVNRNIAYLKFEFNDFFRLHVDARMFIDAQVYACVSLEKSFFHFEKVLNWKWEFFSSLERVRMKLSIWKLLLWLSVACLRLFYLHDSRWFHFSLLRFFIADTLNLFVCHLSHVLNELFSNKSTYVKIVYIISIKLITSFIKIFSGTIVVNYYKYFCWCINYAREFEFN